MHAHNPIADDCAERHHVEHRLERLVESDAVPEIHYIRFTRLGHFPAPFPDFHVESVLHIDGATLMVSAQQEDLVRIRQHQRDQHGYALQ